MPLVMTEDNKYEPGLFGKQGCMIPAVIGAVGSSSMFLSRGMK